jgi:hypothetical protein
MRIADLSLRIEPLKSALRIPHSAMSIVVMALAIAAPAQGNELSSQAARRRSVPAQASPVKASRLRVPKVSRPPQLRDFLSGRPREAEALVTGFRQLEPGDGVPVSQATAAYLSYDERNLYVVFICEDSGSVRGHMAKREEIGEDDFVGVYLDTFNDRRHAYAFEANPLGLQRDGLLNEGQKTDYTFDTVWSTDGQLTRKGYTVWMAIPFKSLRFINDDVQTWGIALRRRILRANEEAYWPHITRRVAGFINQMAPLDDLAQVSAGRNIQVIPYGTFTGSQRLDGAVPSFRTEREQSGGVDAKFVIRDALTVDLTAKPDFSQVESDEPQVTVNQRYEVKFPEKRPFFMENAGFFQTPVNLFYSRRIIEPQLGARLTGKVNRWAVGALTMDDRAAGAVLAQNDPRHANRAATGVFRVQREFGSQSSAGVLVTSRDFGGSANRVAAFDTRLRLNPNLYFTGQIMDSETRDLRGGQSSGQAYLARLDYGGRNFSHSTSFADLAPSFHTDMGYVKRVDLRAVTEYAGYLWYPGGKRLSSFGPSVSVSADWDHRQQLQDWNVYPTFVLNFPRQTSIKVANSRTYELYEGIGFRSSVTEVSAYSAPAKSFGVFASFTAGQAINYAPAAGLAPFLGDSTSASFGWTWRPAERVRLESSYYYTHLTERERALRVIGADRRTVFDNHLARLKVNYQFTRALSVRSILDYYALLPDEALIDYTPSQVLTGDVLLTYLIHPGTALYIGYTNRLENVATDPVAQRLRFTGWPGTVTNRQVFAKVSYLLRF